MYFRNITAFPPCLVDRDCGGGKGGVRWNLQSEQIKHIFSLSSSFVFSCMFHFTGITFLIQFLFKIKSCKKNIYFCFTPCKVETWAPRVVYNVVSSSECNILLLPVLDPSPSNIWDRVWRKGEKPDLLNLINSLAVLNQPELKLSFQLLNL